jgi:hypothetical protein
LAEVPAAIGAYTVGNLKLMTKPEASPVPHCSSSQDVNAANAVGAPNGPLVEFGSGGAYLYYLTESARPGARIGVILFGFGVSECRITRRLSALGFIVMQIRLAKDYENLQHRVRFYDDSGICGLMQAIDELGSKRGIQRVILMGNCAEANLCFNAALTDRRVIGLIMTNLYVNEMLTVVDECRRNLFSLGAWRRLLAGDSSAKVLKAYLRSRMRGASDQSSLAAQSCYKKDLVLPLDFDRFRSDRQILHSRPERSAAAFVANG